MEDQHYIEPDIKPGLGYRVGFFYNFLCLFKDRYKASAEIMMNKLYLWRKKVLRPTALMLTVLLTLPLTAGCGGSRNSTLPPVDDTYGGQTYPDQPTSPRARQGLSTTQKVALLGGAAALSYLDNRPKNRQAQGGEGASDLAKDGRCVLPRCSAPCS